MLDLLQKNSPAFMDVLAPAVADRLREQAVIAKYSDGQLIQSRGDTRAGVSIVRTGSAQLGVFGEDGRFVLMSILGPGQTFGEVTLFTDIPRSQDIVAIGHTEIYHLSATRFKALCADEPQLMEALLAVALVRSHLLLDMLDAIRRLPLLERTARMLQSLHQNSGNSGSIICRQSDLAFMLGVSRVSLSKALRELADEGIIKVGYGHIDFPDIARMSDWVTRRCTVAIAV